MIQKRKWKQEQEWTNPEQVECCTTVKIKQELLVQQNLTTSPCSKSTQTKNNIWFLISQSSSSECYSAGWSPGTEDGVSKKGKGIKVGQVPVNMEEPWRRPPALLTWPTCEGAVFQFLLVPVVKISPRRLQDKWFTSCGTCFTLLCPLNHANKSTLSVCVRCRQGLDSARFGQRLDDVYSCSEGLRKTWVSLSWFIKNKTGCERRSLREISAGGVGAIALGRRGWLGWLTFRSRCKLCEWNLELIITWPPLRGILLSTFYQLWPILFIFFTRSFHSHV